MERHHPHTSTTTGTTSNTTTNTTTTTTSNTTTTNTSTRCIPSGIVAFGLVSFFLGELGDGLNIFQGIYLVNIGWNESAIGIALSLMGFTALVCQTFAGDLIDRSSSESESSNTNSGTNRRTIDRRKILSIAATLTACSALAVLFVKVGNQDHSLMYITKIIEGVASSFIMPCLAALTLANYGGEQFDHVMANNLLWGHIGSALSAILAGVAAYVFYPNIKSCFYVIGVSALCAVYCVRYLPEGDVNMGRGLVVTVVVSDNNKNNDGNDGNDNMMDHDGNGNGNGMIGRGVHKLMSVTNCIFGTLDADMNIESKDPDLKALSLRPPTAVVFIDEIDALAKCRDGIGHNLSFGPGNGNDEREQTLNALLTEMDGFGHGGGGDESGGRGTIGASEHVFLIVIAATNRLSIIDPAILRPGRFDRHVRIDPPDAVGREAILRVHSRNVKLEKDHGNNDTRNDNGNHHMEGVETDTLLREVAADDMTEGFTGADLANVVNEAALLAVRQRSETVKKCHISMAIDRIRVMKTSSRPSFR
mmetsp:Transcript_25331/g.38722  ORF Transcript_25331/g.38722 Transcript_25331/m.38722 type:complete len:533 (+) Transcript_25331:111-1709(+)